MLTDNKTLARLIAFVVPLALLWLWLTFGYTHRYATVTQFVLRNHQDASGMMLGDAALLGASGANQQDLHLIREYILSPNLLETLDQELGLRATYSSSSVLPPQRLDSDASFHAFLEHYRSLLKITIDTTSSIMTLEIEGYDAEQVFKQSQATLTAAEAYVNRVSKEIAERQTASAHQHLEKAREDRAEKNRRLLEFQKQNSTFMPSRDSASALALIGGLEGALASEKARFASMSGLLAANAPAVIESRAKIDALENQIATERSRLIQESPTDSMAFNQMLATFQLIQLDLELATKSYSEALAALQRAQITAAENLKALVIVASATLPEKPAYPRIWVWMLLGTVIQLITAPRIAALLLVNAPRKKKGKGK